MDNDLHEATEPQTSEGRAGRAWLDVLQARQLVFRGPGPDYVPSKVFSGTLTGTITAGGRTVRFMILEEGAEQDMTMTVSVGNWDDDRHLALSTFALTLPEALAAVGDSLEAAAAASEELARQAVSEG
jgi:hypothetical protein